VKRALQILSWLLLVFTIVFAQESERTPLFFDASSFSSVEERGVMRRELRGNVHMIKDSLDVTCDQAVYYPDSGIVIFRYNVVFKDPHRTMFADEVIYNEWTEEAFASTKIRVYQSDTLSVTSRTARYFERLNQGYLYDDVRIHELGRRVLLMGRLGFTDHVKEYGRVTGEPVMTERDSAGLLITRVKGDTVEYFGDRKTVRVTGKVRIERDSLIATGTFLEYLTADRMAVLTGEPEAIRADNHVVGDTIRLYFEKDEKLSRVEVAGNAVATSPADSGFAEPKNRMEGKLMTMWVDSGAISSVLVENSAIATYFVRDKNEKRGMNVTSGDRLRVFFDGRKISRIRVEGGTEGTYTPQRLVSTPEPKTTPR